MTEGDALVLLSVALAYALYRLDVLHRRAEVVAEAQALLIAVREAMIGSEGNPGWGALYFKECWDEKRAAARGSADAAALLAGSYNQVLVVPSEPLAHLATPLGTGDLISIRTVSSANRALWHVENFNQLVLQHTAMMASALPKMNLTSTRAERRERSAVARAVGAQSKLLHLRGVGTASCAGGWYHELCSAIDDDVDRLGGLRRWYRQYSIPDVVAAGAVLASVVICIAVYPRQDGAGDAPAGGTTTLPAPSVTVR